MTEDMPEDVKAAARNWVVAVDQRFTLADSFMPWAREYLEEVAASAILAERRRCAQIAEGFPASVLQFYPRPGSPPGNTVRPSNGRDIAAAILGDGHGEG